MSIINRIESIFGPDQDLDWAELARRRAPIDAAAINAGEGNRLHLYSIGHAQEIEQRLIEIQEKASADGNRPLTLEEWTRVSALEDILMRGAYLLSAKEEIHGPTVGGVIVTQAELERSQGDPSKITVAETPALRGAAAVGRLLNAEEIAAYERAESKQKRRFTM